VSWPNDADGDVLRKLYEGGFDFGQVHKIDFNIDFRSWPPAELAIDFLRKEFGAIEICEPTNDFNGYISFQVTERVTYEGVTSMQRRLTREMQPYGGVCDSWGVWGAS
jgi:hypothetical protein